MRSHKGVYQPQSLTLTLALILFSGCSTSNLVEEKIPLYRLPSWTPPLLVTRSFDFGTEEIFDIEGREIVGTYSDTENLSPAHSDSQYADQDFWRFYLETYAVRDIGFDTIFLEERHDNRAIVGLRDDDGHIVMLSHIVTFHGEVNGEPDCPCDYRFTIFTNHPQVLLE